MANTVDERIVAAKFDASDFEKGVDKTVKKLDELKKALNLKDSGKTLAEFADETSKGVDKANSALERLSQRFTTFKGMITQNILGGLAQQVSNAFLSIERSVLGLAKTLGSDQISVGMNKYTEILNSVRTMTAAGVVQDVAYEQIKRLAEYSDQTSYSLNQMTSAMSKLVAAGMGVQNAEKSVEGLANMAASAGVNIYDAQRAFMNFSQAYSSGSMRIQDWTSFESLNMATENVMKVFMEAAEQVGTLTKTVSKDGKTIYKTVNSVNKAVKANKEVATQGFRDTLSYGWLDRKTMEQATAVLSYFEDLGVSINDLTEEQLNTFAARAFTAAKEARSFADVMGTLKDVIATGWATTFELIFGKLDEATKFFTWLSESNLAEAIYSIGEFRNTVLKAWGTDWLNGGVFKTGMTGRDSILAALKNIDELIGMIHEGLEELMPTEFISQWADLSRNTLSFAESIGKNLGIMSYKFKVATEDMLGFLTEERELSDGTKTTLLQQALERIAKIATGIGSVFGVVSKLAGIASKTIGKVFEKILPVIGAVGDAFGIILEPFVDLNNNAEFFQNITNAIDNFLIVLDPILQLVPPVIEVLGELGKFFVGMAVNTITTNIELISEAFSFIIELFGGTSAAKVNEGVGIIEGWGKDIEAFAETCKNGLAAVKEFFVNLFDDILKLFGIREKEPGEEGGFFEGITNFFDSNEFVQKVKAWVNQAIADVQTFIRELPAKVEKLGDIISTFWNSLFYTKKKVKINGKEQEINVPTRLKMWLDQAIRDVKKFIKSIPGKIAKIPSLLGELWHSLFWKKVQTVDPDTGEASETEISTALGNWFNKVKNKVSTFIQSIPGKLVSLPSLLQEFWHGLFWKKVKTVNPDTDEVEEVEVRTALGEWLENAKKTASDFIKDIPNNIKTGVLSGFSLIETFIHSLLWKKVKTVNPDTDEVEEVEIRTALNDWLTTAKDTAIKFIKDIPNNVKTGVLSGFNLIGTFIDSLLWRNVKTVNPDTDEVEDVKIHTALGEWLETAKENAKAFIKSIPEKIETGISLLGKFIHGLLWDPEVDAEGNLTGQEVPNALNKWLQQATQDAAAFIESMPDMIRGVPSLIGMFVDSLTGKAQRDKKLEQAKAKIYEQFTDKDGNIVDPWKLRHALEQAEKNIAKESEGFNLWGAIKEIAIASGNAALDLGPDILNAMSTGLSWIGEKVSNFTELIDSRNKEQPFTEWLQELIFGKEGSENAELASAVKNLGETIKTLITSTLPNFISAAFDEIITGIPVLVNKLFGGMSESIENVEANMAGSEGGKQLTFADMMANAFVSLFAGANADEITDTVEGATEVITAVGEAGKASSEAAKNAKGLIQLPTQLPGTVGQILGGLVENLGKFAGSDLGQIALIVLGMAAVISSLSEVVQLSDELREGAKLAKWEAIKTAILGIVGLFAYIAIAGMSGNEQQIANAEALFDKMTNLLDRIGNLLKILAGFKLATSISNTVGTIKGAGGLAAGAASGITSSIGTLINTLLLAFGVAEGGDIVTTGAENWAKNMNQVFQSTGIGMEDLLGAVQNLAAINDQIDSAKDAIGKIAEVFEMLRSLFVITEQVEDSAVEVDTEDLSEPISDIFTAADGVEKYIAKDGTIHDASELSGKMRKSVYVTKSILSEFTQIMSMFTQFSGAMTLFKQSISTNGENTEGVTNALGTLMGMKGDMAEFAAFAESNEFTKFKTALMSLGGALQLYSLADINDLNQSFDPGKVETAITLLQQIFGNHQLRDLIQTLSADELGDTDELMTNAESITIFAGALASIAKACSDLTDDTGGDIQKLITTLQEIKPKNGENITEISQQFGELGNAIASFAVNTMGLTDTNLANASTALTMVLDLAKGLKDIPSDTVLAKIFTGDKSLESFGLGIQALGGNLKVFFEEIQNAGMNGMSRDYNRTNLEQVLMALDALSSIAVRLRNAMYMGSTFQDVGSWLTGPIGDLTGFGKNIMAFINEINDFSTADNKKVDFQFVYSAIEALGKLVEIPNKMPYYKDLPKKIQQLGEVINGAGASHGGVLGYLNPFFESILEISTKYSENYNMTDLTSMINSYATMVEQIVDLLALIGGKDQNALGVMATKNPTEYLIPIFTSINDNYEAFKELFANAATFDQNGVETLKTFFGSLQSLAQGLTLFSKQDTSGEFNVLTGLSTLLGFNWSSLTSIKDNMLEIFSADDFNAVGQMAGSNLDQGLANGINGGAAIAAAQALAGAIQGSFTVSWQISSPSKVFAGFGKYLDLGLEQGITENSEAPVEAAEAMSEQVVNNSMSILEGIKSLVLDELDLTPTVTPVVDMTNVNLAKAQLEEFGFGGLMFGTSGLNFSAQGANPGLYGNQTPDYSGLFSSLNTTLASMGNTPVNVTTEMSGVQVVLDTGALVGALIGEIDTRLGRMGFYAGREG